MSRKRVGILISGRGSNMATLVKAAAAADYPAEAVLVLSNRPEAGGLAIAREAGIPTATVDHKDFPGDKRAFEQAMDEKLRAAGVEIVCLAGFMRLLSPWFVEAWRDRLLNIHPSLLPSFKGIDTHERALEAGTRIHGCTVHIVRPEVDSGPIIAQAAVPVQPEDTPDTLGDRVLTAEHLLYPHALRLFASGAVRIEGDRAVMAAGGAEPPALFMPPLG